MFGAAAKKPSKHRETLKFHGKRSTVLIPKELGTQTAGRMHLKIKNTRSPMYGIGHQPIPIHDFINFKKMCGNEVLLNLENNMHLTNSELISGLTELARRDSNHEHDWNEHPISARCIADLRSRQPNLRA